MKRYIGVKEIIARSMNRTDYNVYRGWDLPSDEDGTDKGFLVEYIDGGQSNHPDHDGYISWSPKEVFEKVYRAVDGMPFGLAIEAMKLGYKVARVGWNGKGMFTYWVPGGDFKALTDTAKSIGVTVRYNPYFAIKTVNDTISTWVPSINDALAEDWQIIT